MRQLLRTTYLAVIRGSVGSKMFRNFYALAGGGRKDILRDGDLSCAYFVSAVLHLFKLIEAPHVTVAGTVRDMEKTGWFQIKKPKAGCVIVWEARAAADGEPHKHIGFSIGKDAAVSNSERLRTPALHHWTFGHNPSRSHRKPESIWWHKKLDSISLDA